jgi:hypothetical protein
MEEFYRLEFKVEGLDGYPPKEAEKLKTLMGSELMRVSKMFADGVNSGITESLNKEWERLYPTYFEDNKGRDFLDNVEYLRYMADGYQRLIVDDLNKKNVSKILGFYVEPKEVAFTGYWKSDKRVTIEYYFIKI